MFTKQKRCIVSLALVVATMVTMFVGYANATEASVASVNSQPYWFYLTLPAYGVTDLATPRAKEDSVKAAFYDLYTADNYGSGYSLWINVRNSGGTAIVGTAEPVPYADTYWVSYLSGYGNVGTSYRPSGQTNSQSALGGYIDGYWNP